MKIKSFIASVGLATVTAGCLAAAQLARVAGSVPTLHSVAGTTMASPLLGGVSNPFLAFIYFILSFFRHVG